MYFRLHNNIVIYQLQWWVWLATTKARFCVFTDQVSRNVVDVKSLIFYYGHYLYFGMK